MSDMTGRCRTCKWWKAYGDNPVERYAGWNRAVGGDVFWDQSVERPRPHLAGLGLCERFPCPGDDGSDTDLSAQTNGAMVVGDYGEGAQLITSPEFGCVQWQAAVTD